MTLGPEHWIALAVLLSSTWAQTTAGDALPQGDATHDHLTVLASVLMV